MVVVVRDVADDVAVCLEVVLDLDRGRGQPPDHAVRRWGLGAAQLVACAYCLQEESVDGAVCLVVDAIGRVVHCGQE